jgi:Ca2+-binding RTX toxin-like protein
LALASSSVLPGGAGESSAAGIACLGQPATIVGTDGADLIVGTDHADVIVGLGADDVVRGLGGLVLGRGDHADGGAGADVLRSRPAGDVVAEGGGGDDTFVGGAGSDTFYDLFAGSGRDVATGAGGGDIIALGVGDDDSVGGAGPDALMAGPGSDRVVGGVGRDTFSGGFLHADGFTVNLRLGIANGGGTGAAGDTLATVEHIDGSADDDVLIGDRQNNVIFAGPGNDDLHGGAGSDHWTVMSTGTQPTVALEPTCASPSARFDASADRLRTGALPERRPSNGRSPIRGPQPQRCSRGTKSSVRSPV